MDNYLERAGITSKVQGSQLGMLVVAKGIAARSDRTLLGALLALLLAAMYNSFYTKRIQATKHLSANNALAWSSPPAGQARNCPTAQDLFQVPQVFHAKPFDLYLATCSSQLSNSGSAVGRNHVVFTHIVVG